jgi:hypothetical protein
MDLLEKEIMSYLQFQLGSYLRLLEEAHRR